MADARSGRARGGQRRQGASRGNDAAAGHLSTSLRWYAGGVLSGVFLSFMFYLVTLPPSRPGTDSDTSANAVAPVSAEQQPRFDFFEMLPQQRIEVELEPGTKTANRDQRSGTTYLLQAGSFRQAEDADRRRAELLLLGLEPDVEETSGNNGRWFRVMVGPFDSRSKMAAARSLTAQQNIDTLLLQRGTP
ncbi:MAG: SPOR domain-containing protein [Chromatocurvus sp.]